MTLLGAGSQKKYWYSNAGLKPTRKETASTNPDGELLWPTGRVVVNAVITIIATKLFKNRSFGRCSHEYFVNGYLRKHWLNWVPILRSQICGQCPQTDMRYTLWFMMACSARKKAFNYDSLSAFCKRVHTRLTYFKVFEFNLTKRCARNTPRGQAVRRRPIGMCYKCPWGASKMGAQPVGRDLFSGSLVYSDLIVISWLRIKVWIWVSWYNPTRLRRVPQLSIVNYQLGSSKNPWF